MFCKSRKSRRAYEKNKLENPVQEEEKEERVGEEEKRVKEEEKHMEEDLNIN